MQLRHWGIIFLCCLLLPSGVARAYPSLDLGLGYAKNCSAAGADRSCREAMRGEVLLNLGGRDRRLFQNPFQSKGTLAASKSSDYGVITNCDWHKKKKDDDDKDSGCGGGGNCGTGGGNCGGGGGGDALVAVAAIAVALLVAYGLIIGVAYLLSSQQQVGIYYSEDRFLIPGSDPSTSHQGSWEVVRRVGLMASFFPVESWPLRFQVGGGPAAVRAEGRLNKTDEKKSDDFRRGVATKLGLGLAPRPGNDGPFLVYEAEYMSLKTKSLAELVDQNTRRDLPRISLSNAALFGWVVAF